jgi:hypothetical protein
MIYPIELDPKAMSALFSLDQREAEFVSFSLFRLAESPRELSDGSALLSGMVYSFRLAGAVDADAIWFTVTWQYKREEIVYVGSITRFPAALS